MLERFCRVDSSRNYRLAGLFGERHAEGARPEGGTHPGACLDSLKSSGGRGSNGHHFTYGTYGPFTAGLHMLLHCQWCWLRHSEWDRKSALPWVCVKYDSTNVPCTSSQIRLSNAAGGAHNFTLCLCHFRRKLTLWMGWIVLEIS